MGFPLFRPAAKMKTLICHTVNVIQSADGCAVAAAIERHCIAERIHAHPVVFIGRFYAENVVARLDLNFVRTGNAQRFERDTVGNILPVDRIIRLCGERSRNDFAVSPHRERLDRGFIAGRTAVDHEIVIFPTAGLAVER